MCQDYGVCPEGWTAREWVWFAATHCTVFPFSTVTGLYNPPNLLCHGYWGSFHGAEAGGMCLLFCCLLFSFVCFKIDRNRIQALVFATIMKRSFPHLLFRNWQCPKFCFSSHIAVQLVLCEQWNSAPMSHLMCHVFCSHSDITEWKKARQPIGNSSVTYFKNYLSKHILMRLHEVFTPSICCGLTVVIVAGNSQWQRGDTKLGWDSQYSNWAVCYIDQVLEVQC